MNEHELDALIRQTQPQPEFEHSFQREVWARIAVAEQRSGAALWRQWSEALLRWLAQPAPAVAVVMTMLLIGAGLGNVTAPDSRAALRSAYVASINPLTAAHTALQE